MSFTTRRGSAFYKRPLALIGATALTAGAMVPLAGAANAIEEGVENTCAGLTDNRFVDLVSYTQDTQDAINCLASYGITVGTGDGTTYEPGRQVLRWEMALFLDRLITYVDENNDDISFADNDDTSSFDDLDSVPQEGKEAIARLADLGIAQGFNDDEYGPYNSVLRRQMASFLDRIQAEIAAQSDDAEDFTATMDEDEAIYLDVPPGHPQYEDIYSISNAGIAEGTGGDLFQPNAATTRSQMALFLTRHLDALVDQGVIEGEAVLPVESNQDYLVTPQEQATLTVAAAPDDDASDDRRYTVTGLEDGTYRIALVAGGNVTVDENGVVTFSEQGTSNLADFGTPSAVITVVNGTDIADVAQTTASPVGGQITFTVDGTTAGSVVPVVWSETDGDGRLDLGADNQPTEMFGVGGETTYVLPEADFGTEASVSVASVSAASDLFQTATNTYYYDANDVFQLDGVGITLDQFESVLSAGDVLSVSYNPSPTGVSTFDITTDAGTAAPAAATAQVTNADGEAIPNDVRVTYTRPDDNNPGTTYTLLRATVDTTTDPDTVGAFIPVTTATQAQNADGTWTFTDADVAAGTYRYRVDAIHPVTGVATVGTAASPDATIASTPDDTTAPTIADLRVATVAGLTGTLDVGDTFTLAASEPFEAVATGDTLRLTDADGTIVDVVNATNSTFALNPAAVTIGGVSYAAGEVLTVEVTTAPTIVSPGSIAGLQLPSTLIDQAGLADASSNNLRVTGDTTLDVES